MRKTSLFLGCVALLSCGTGAARGEGKDDGGSGPLGSTAPTLSVTGVAPTQDVCARNRIRLSVACDAPPQILVDGRAATVIATEDASIFDFATDLGDGQTAHDVTVRCAIDGTVVSASTRAVLAASGPPVASISPDNGAADVAFDAVMRVTFCEAVDPATVNKNSFQISGVTGTISADPDGRTFSFKPDQPLACATRYNCVVTTEVKSLRTKKALRPTIAPPGGNVAADKDYWTFTTAACP